jgi:hypothetical protein
VVQLNVTTVHTPFGNTDPWLDKVTDGDDVFRSHDPRVEQITLVHMNTKICYLQRETITEPLSLAGENPATCQLRQC